MFTTRAFDRHVTAAELRRLRGLLRSKVVDHATADDLLQEALLKFWRKLPTLRDERAAAGFLHRIVYHTLLDFLRKTQCVVELDASNFQLAASDDVPSAQGPDLTAHFAAYIAREVDALPANYREVLRAVDFEGMRQVEFAKAQGLAYSTVKSRYQRARQLLRERVDACCAVRTDGYGHVLRIQAHRTPTQQTTTKHEATSPEPTSQRP